jgi:hypothetical protein
LIELENVPEVEEINLEQYKFDIDFDNYKEVLVNQQNFSSMEKAITELKNKFYMPQQSSLF